MKHTDTICYKIDEFIERLKVEDVSGEDTALFLTKIKEDSQHMENAIRLRKRHMVDEGIEQSYQNRKANMKDGKDIPGVNTVVGNPKMVKGYTKVEITVKEQGKIVYQKESKAGVICTVERVEEMKVNDPYTYGQTQTFEWGPPVAIVFAFDQLSQAIEKYKLVILNALKELKMTGKNKPEDLVKKMNELLKKSY